jgi:hypothetical protein
MRWDEGEEKKKKEEKETKLFLARNISLSVLFGKPSLDRTDFLL